MIWPHRPVLAQVHAKDVVLWRCVADQPQPPPVLAKRGRGRRPRDWDKFHDDVQHVTTADQMARFWDATLRGIEAELLDRRD
eukprot:8140997-Pyramimonas_sp.AAC.1